MSDSNTQPVIQEPTPAGAAEALKTNGANLPQPQVVKAPTEAEIAVNPARARPFTIHSNVRPILYLKALVYADYGVGKTYLMGTSSQIPYMRDILLVSAEAGELTLFDPDAPYEFSLIDIVHTFDYHTLSEVHKFLKLHCSAREAAEQGDKEAIANLMKLQKFLMPNIPDPDRLRLFKTVIIDSLAEAENMCVAEGTWVWGPQGICKIEDHPDALYKGVKETIKVRTQRGFELIITPDHEVLTQTGWKQAYDLSGETLVHKDNEIIKQSEADPEYWWMVGFWLGDGTIRKECLGQISFAVGLGEDRKATTERLSSLFSSRFKESPRENKGNIYLTGQRTVVEHIRSMFGMRYLQEHHAKNLFCPLDKIQNISAFLQGLFDADGGVTFKYGGSATFTTSVHLSSKSEELLRDVQVALSGYGIYGTIRTNNSAKTVSYFLDISDIRSQQLFSQYIGFSLPSKKEKLQRAIEGRNPSYQTYPRVVSVERGPDCKVYDLVNQPDQRFVANGLVVHNCMMQLTGVTTESMIDEEPGMTGWDEYRNQRTMIHKLIRGFRNLPVNTLFTCPRHYRKTDTKPPREIYMPMMTGKLAREVQGFVDIVGHYVAGDAGQVELTEEEKEKGIVPDVDIPRRLYIQPGPKFDAKSRFSRYKKPWFDNPTMLSITQAVGLYKLWHEIAEGSRDAEGFERSPSKT